MEDRSWGGVEGGKEYRYGFNGKENDRDLSSSQLIQDYGFRVYNPVIGRFLSVDPLTKSYPWYTPYQFAGNTPVQAIDLDGLEEFVVTSQYFANFFLDKEYLNSIYISEKQKQSITTWLHKGETSETFNHLFMRYHDYNKDAIQMVDEKAPFKVSVKNSNMYCAEELTTKFQKKYNINSNDHVGFGLGPVKMADMPISTHEADEKGNPAAMYLSISVNYSLIVEGGGFEAGGVLKMQGRNKGSVTFFKDTYDKSFGSPGLGFNINLGATYYEGNPYDFSIEDNFLGERNAGSLGLFGVSRSKKEDQYFKNTWNVGVSPGFGISGPYKGKDFNGNEGKSEKID
ncbi:hypothetical protein HHU12_24915 [Flammeovirga aprica JL-4]|uniref:RHS repeat-associated core domain-containing protein n=2 Tax=Flammeovirga aprica TaxID=29528 RepID=A0A7X9XBZ9_9BACT|nr:hypothetical protein [Flammeovirga aprica JL-4]